MQSIVIFVDYFGQWPCWLDMFLESCRYNPTINWHIHTDCLPPDDAPPNVYFEQMTFEEYCAYVSTVLELNFRPHTSYNICNLKPMFGSLYQEIAAKYDYYGWGDIDVVYGDLRSFLTPYVLQHTVISTHSHICSGHFTLIRNDARLHEAFRHLSNWETCLEEPGRFDWHQSLAEPGLTALFSPVDSTRNRFAAQFCVGHSNRRFYQNNYFAEQWTTPFTPLRWLNHEFVHPEIWRWNKGTLTNSSDGKRTFMYLHLMNFKRKCWVNEELYGESSTWADLSPCMKVSLDQLRRQAQGFVRIDRAGIHLMNVG